MRKPSPGTCGYCGAPVRRPSRPVAMSDLRLHGRRWVAGHLYEERDGAPKLIRVRCRTHAEADDPRLEWHEVHAL